MDIVAKVEAAPGYNRMPFTVETDAVDGLIVTYKMKLTPAPATLVSLNPAGSTFANAGQQLLGVVSAEPDAHWGSSYETTTTWHTARNAARRLAHTEADSGSPHIQRLTVTGLTIGQAYVLEDGAEVSETMLASGNGPATVEHLLAGWQDASEYPNMPFTLEAEGNVVRLRYKSRGEVKTRALMRRGTGTILGYGQTVVIGGASQMEVQEITVDPADLTTQATYQLSTGVRLTSANLATADAPGLVTAIQSAPDPGVQYARYSDLPFVVAAESATVVRVTYKTSAPKRAFTAVTLTQAGQTNALATAVSETVLRFTGLSFAGPGQYKVCFCDSKLLPKGTRHCTTEAHYAVTVGDLQVSGLSCLLAQPKLNRASCVPQYYGGLSCIAHRRGGLHNHNPTTGWSATADNPAAGDAQTQGLNTSWSVTAPASGRAEALAKSVWVA